MMWRSCRYVHAALIHQDMLALSEAGDITSAFSTRVAAQAFRELAAHGPTLPPAGMSRPRIAVRNLAAFPKALWLAERARRWQADHIHAYWGSVPATVAWAAATRVGIPWSFTLHRWDIHEDNLLQEARGGRLRTLYRWIRQKRSAFDVPNGAGPIVIHLGVRSNVKTAPLRDDRVPLRVLVPGALVKRKGHSILFEAIAAAGPLVESVDLVGEGPTRLDLESIANDLGIAPLVHFIGQLEHRAFLSRIEQGEWDVVLLPSVPDGGEAEGIPVSLMEAMAAGVPVVGTDWLDG